MKGLILFLLLTPLTALAQKTYWNTTAPTGSNVATITYRVRGTDSLLIPTMFINGKYYDFFTATSFLTNSQTFRNNIAVNGNLTLPTNFTAISAPNIFSRGNGGGASHLNGWDLSYGADDGHYQFSIRKGNNSPTQIFSSDTVKIHNGGSAGIKVVGNNIYDYNNKVFLKDGQAISASKVTNGLQLISPDSIGLGGDLTRDNIINVKNHILAFINPTTNGGIGTNGTNSFIQSDQYTGSRSSLTTGTNGWELDYNDGFNSFNINSLGLITDGIRHRGIKIDSLTIDPHNFTKSSYVTKGFVDSTRGPDSTKLANTYAKKDTTRHLITEYGKLSTSDRTANNALYASALTAMPNGATLIIPQGIWPIDMATSRGNIHISGAKTPTFDGTTATGTVILGDINFTNQQNIEVSNLCFDQRTYLTPVNGVTGGKSPDTFDDNFYIHDVIVVGRGYAATGSNHAFLFQGGRNVRIERCAAYNFLHGFALRVSNFSVTDCYAYNMEGEAFLAKSSTLGGSNICYNGSFTNCIAQSGAALFFAYNENNGQDTKNINFVNCISRNSNTYAFQVGGLANLSGINFTNCQADSSANTSFITTSGAYINFNNCYSNYTPAYAFQNTSATNVNVVNGQSRAAALGVYSGAFAIANINGRFIGFVQYETIGSTGVIVTGVNIDNGTATPQLTTQNYVQGVGGTNFRGYWQEYIYPAGSFVKDGFHKSWYSYDAGTGTSALLFDWKGNGDYSVAGKVTAPNLVNYRYDLSADPTNTAAGARGDYYPGTGGLYIWTATNTVKRLLYDPTF